MGMLTMNSWALASSRGADGVLDLGVRPAVGDVLPDRAAEQQRVLQHEADLSRSDFSVN